MSLAVGHSPAVKVDWSKNRPWFVTASVATAIATLLGLIKGTFILALVLLVVSIVFGVLAYRTDRAA